jgi:PEP-CTERM motif-containing protein
MPAAPSNVMSPTGWTDLVTNGGKAIQWTASSLLMPGGTVTGFQFDSTMTPAQLAGPFPGPGLGTGDPVATAFLYIAAPLADPGMQITATPGAVGTPEPGTLTLAGIAIGLIGLASVFRKRVLSV